MSEAEDYHADVRDLIHDNMVKAVCKYVPKGQWTDALVNAETGLETEICRALKISKPGS